MSYILIVEDDLEITEQLTLFLTNNGFYYQHLDSGEQVVETVKDNPPDLILLDIMLPQKSGIECCREIRAFADIPIVMMTAKVEEIDRLVGLEAGADDYVCKPFSAAELMLRIKAILRRSQTQSATTKVHLDSNTYKLSYQNQVIELTHLEFNLFNLLYSNPERIYSREQILDLAYPDLREISDRTIDSHVRNIRKKALLFNFDKTIIESVYGAGYRYSDPSR